MDNAEKISIQCFGDCGCSVTLRKGKVRSAHYYLCRSKREAKLPPLPSDMFRRIEMNAAGNFRGLTYEVRRARAEKVTIQCFGECGCSVTLRKSSLRHAHYYVCNSRKHGLLCQAKIPPLPPGMVRGMQFNAASYFTGFTDEWPDAETAAAVRRAKGCLAAAVADFAIEKARKGS
jgi:hypothetical protein